jgi:DNA mismatch endonuclease (patch repair protein)
MGNWPGNPLKEKTTFGNLSRSELMSRVRSRGNLTTELRMAKLLRRAHLKGWRRHLPILGRPDFTWPKEKLVLFVDGCFWHGHACGRKLMPNTNRKAWQQKIEANKKRDRKIRKALRNNGWKVVSIWECELSNSPERCVKKISSLLKKTY